MADFTEVDTWLEPEEVEELTVAQRSVAFARACKAMDIPYEWFGDMVMIAIEFDDQALMQAYYEQLELMVLADVFRSLADKGLVETRLEEDGRLGYYATEKTIEALGEDDG